jgi:GGDEF domain-containing protein
MSSVSPQGYSRTRNLVLGSGLAVLLIIAGVMYVRRVESVEVLGTLLFIPIFIAFVFQGLRGGAIAGALAAVAYAAFRYPAIDLVGAGRVTSLILSRAVAYLAFGLIGGLATQQLRSSITKLDATDQVDDETGLFNARFFVDNTGLEMQRSDRYHTVFCAVIVDVPSDPLTPLNRRQRERVMRELGEAVSDSARTMDRGVHAFDGRRHRFAVVLPETGRDGGRVFVGRLAQRMADLLTHRGVRIDATAVESDVAMFPGDDEALQRLRTEFAEIEAREHPETAHALTALPASSPEQRRD